MPLHMSGIWFVWKLFPKPERTIVKDGKQEGPFIIITFDLWNSQCKFNKKIPDYKENLRIHVLL